MAIIRNATLIDAAEIARVHNSSWQTTYKGIISDDYLSKVNERYLSGKSKELREQKFSNNGQSIFVALIDNKIVGFADGGLNRTPVDPFDAEIYAIYIEQKYQKIGIGKQLVNAFIEKYMIPNKLKSMLIHVLADNSSAHFYKKTGGVLYSSKLDDLCGGKFQVDTYAWNDVCKI